MSQLEGCRVSLLTPFQLKRQFIKFTTNQSTPIQHLRKIRDTAMHGLVKILTWASPIV